MPALLRSVWAEPRPADPPRRTWRDWALLAAVWLLAPLEARYRPGLAEPGWPLAVAVGLAPALLWRRAYPLLTTAVTYLGSGAVALFAAPGQPDMYATVYFVLFPYALFRWGSGREAVAGFGVLAAHVLGSLALSRTDIAGAAGSLGVLGAAAGLGAAVRYREKVRARELERAKLLERESLARDLHDTVAHHFSAIAIRAQAGLAVAPARPEAPAEALRLIETEAARALAEMRAMVGVLRRDEPAELAPVPGVADIALLADQPGPPVGVRLAGRLDDLAPAVGSALYRLAQESVTNARRHARHATRVSILVEAGDRDVRLSVSDDGTGSAGGVRGFGLTGMIERAELLGGTCEAGPAPAGGWLVSAVLPKIPHAPSRNGVLA
ncbi:sensor histidine kinase [Longispora albida]|uniref:sensor histidine kinase n=1 Tax=Longispora albida TaxID=203523 RepID=UPI0003828EE5|nr:histidine kinase [Longispora albida]